MTQWTGPRIRRTRPIHMTRLSDLLFEESVSFEEFVDASGVKDLGDDVNKEKVSADIAAALNKEVGEEVVTGIPEVEEQPADEPPRGLLGYGHGAAAARVREGGARSH